MTKEYFLTKSNIVHGNEFIYPDLTDIIKTRDKINILCKKHGIFQQNVAAHLRGQKCKKCFNDKESLGFEEFEKKAKHKHNNKYVYDYNKYINNKTPIKITCPIHGVFEQRPDAHLQGNGCIKCAYEYRRELFQNKNVIDAFKLVHDDNYDYSLVEYINNKTKVKIICPIHGVFKQTSYNHLRGFGCNICKLSVGEKKIIDYLKENKIEFIQQKTFKDCKIIKFLFYDFYLPEYNICIEFDGRQHFESVEYWGGEIGLKERQFRDKYKTQYCKDNNIKLIRIRYDENVVEKLKLI